MKRAFLQNKTLDLNSDEFELWKYVLSVSDSITTEAKSGDVTKKDLLAYLETIEEAFGKNSDPVKDFQGFVLLELCRSLRRSLDRAT